MIFCMRKLKIKGEVYEKSICCNTSINASGKRNPCADFRRGRPEADSDVVAQENRL